MGTGDPRAGFGFALGAGLFFLVYRKMVEGLVSMGTLGGFRRADDGVGVFFGLAPVRIGQRIGLRGHSCLR